jgi:hypothetical protein
VSDPAETGRTPPQTKRTEERALRVLSLRGTSSVATIAVAPVELTPGVCPGTHAHRERQRRRHRRLSCARAGGGMSGVRPTARSPVYALCVDASWSTLRERGPAHSEDMSEDPAPSVTSTGRHSSGPFEVKSGRTSRLVGRLDETLERSQTPKAARPGSEPQVHCRGWVTCLVRARVRVLAPGEDPSTASFTGPGPRPSSSRAGASCRPCPLTESRQPALRRRDPC